MGQENRKTLIHHQHFQIIIILNNSFDFEHVEELAESCWNRSDLQSQNAVSAYLLSREILNSAVLDSPDIDIG